MSVTGIKKRFDSNSNTELTEDNKFFFTIPYVNGISEKFKKISKKHDLKLAYSSVNSLNKFITTGKDKLNSLGSCDVVYKINCQDCNASYVGQTKRLLKTRIKEHVNDIKKSGSPSVISNHRLSHNHEFDWEGVRTLDSEQSWNKRIVSEMIHIKRQIYGINKQSDTDLLPEIYFPVIDMLSPQ